MTFDVQRDGFSVRAATRDDAKACRMLLPRMAGQAMFLVGVDGAHGLVVAAAAVTHSRRHKPPTGPGIEIHVIPSCRGAGLGTSLLAHLADYARRCGDEMLYASHKVDVESDEFQGWRRLQFEPVETVQHHELMIDALIPRLLAAVTSLKRSGQVPDGARIVPLYAADREAVLDLHTSHLGGDRDALRARLHGRTTDAFHPRYSRVLLVDDRICGCLLAHRTGRDVAAVDAVVIAPEYRLGWANAWLRLEACQGATSIGVERIRFTTFDHYQDSRQFATQFHGAITRTRALMGRPLASFPQA